MKHTIIDKIKPCPACHDAWIYWDELYRMNCKCGYAWNTTEWKETANEAVEYWNKIVEQNQRQQY